VPLPRKENIFLGAFQRTFGGNILPFSLSCAAFVTNAVVCSFVTQSQLSGGIGIDSLDVPREESSLSIPHHPLGVKPLGNKYTATSDAKDSTGYFRIFPDEISAIFLEYLEAPELLVLGSTCKFLYAFCRSDDIWKALFIE